MYSWLNISLENVREPHEGGRGPRPPLLIQPGSGPSRQPHPDRASPCTCSVSDTLEVMAFAPLPGSETFRTQRGAQMPATGVGASPASTLASPASPSHPPTQHAQALRAKAPPAKGVSTGVGRMWQEEGRAVGSALGAGPAPRALRPVGGPPARWLMVPSLSVPHTQRSSPGVSFHGTFPMDPSPASAAAARVFDPRVP